MALRAETLVTDLERRISSKLQPVVQQARWAVEQIERGNVMLDDAQALNAFVMGSLGAAPQVAGIAITSPRAVNRRWQRSSVQPIVEDWRGRPAVTAWLEDGASLSGPRWRAGPFFCRDRVPATGAGLPAAGSTAAPRGPAWHSDTKCSPKWAAEHAPVTPLPDNGIALRWRAPFWTPTLDTTILLLDTPIRIDGEFAGVFSLVVTVSDLSMHIASVSAETGIMPFILYDRDRVLAHPLLISWAPVVTDRDQPLVAVDGLGDAVLERIWTPDREKLYLLGGLTDTSSSGVEIGEVYYVYLYRDIDRFGPTGPFFCRDRVPATGAGLPAAGSTAAPRGPAWHSDTKCSPKWAAEHAPVTPLPDNGIALFGPKQACLMLKPATPLAVFRGLDADFAERATKPMGAVAP